MFPDTNVVTLKLTFEQLVGHIALFLKYQTAHELVYGGGTAATNLFKIQISLDIYLAVRAEWLNAHVTMELVHVEAFHIVIVGDERSTSLLGLPTVQLPWDELQT